MDTTKLLNTYWIIKNKDLIGWNFNYNLQLYDVVARLKMPEELEWLITKSELNIRARLDTAEYNTFSESGKGGGSGYFIMPYGMLNVSVNEMLLQSFNDTLQVFPCVMPMFTGKPLLFRNLQANNGFSVSATWDNAKTRKIEILSRNGNVCVLKIPQSWTDINVYNGNQKVEIKTDKAKNTISFVTQAGRTYIITDKN
jgi:hypothetical protein